MNVDVSQLLMMIGEREVLIVALRQRVQELEQQLAKTVTTKE